MIDIYATNINWGGNSPYFCKVTLKFLENKKSRVEQYKRSVISKLFIKLILVKYYNMNLCEINIVRNQYGKPFLASKNMESNLYFNISHSGEWIVCAISNNEIGIDIEKVDTYSHNIAKRFYSNNEYNTFLDKNEYERDKYFFDIWTLKESYVKALGKGLSVPFNSFSFSLNDNTISLRSDFEDSHWFFKQYEISKGYCLSLCARVNEFPLKVKKLTCYYLHSSSDMIKV